ncbi:hypothetical protein ADUPG1_010198 [Aduncisulcus paluster]|uniref:Uncharacterized protein n=1 Tax=Aduncisulcus paluster TaxID=2918883 RepID=A0ABQ5JQA1_9EUKA|nr:hypothetical protein ADUPG1_010198 [Aduncisulcus paluster]
MPCFVFSFCISDIFRIGSPLSAIISIETNFATADADIEATGHFQLIAANERWNAESFVLFLLLSASSLAPFSYYHEYGEIIARCVLYAQISHLNKTRVRLRREIRAKYRRIREQEWIERRQKKREAMIKRRKERYDIRMKAIMSEDEVNEEELKASELKERTQEEKHDQEYIKGCQITKLNEWISKVQPICLDPSSDNSFKFPTCVSRAPYSIKIPFEDFETFPDRVNIELEYIRAEISLFLGDQKVLFDYILRYCAAKSIVPTNSQIVNEVRWNEEVVRDFLEGFDSYESEMEKQELVGNDVSFTPLCADIVEPLSWDQQRFVFVGDDSEPFADDLFEEEEAIADPEEQKELRSKHLREIACYSLVKKNSTKLRSMSFSVVEGSLLFSPSFFSSLPRDFIKCLCLRSASMGPCLLRTPGVKICDEDPEFMAKVRLIGGDNSFCYESSYIEGETLSPLIEQLIRDVKVFLEHYHTFSPSNSKNVLFQNYCLWKIMEKMEPSIHTKNHLLFFSSQLVDSSFEFGFDETPLAHVTRLLKELSEDSCVIALSWFDCYARMVACWKLSLINKEQEKALKAQALKFAHEIVKRSDYCEWYALADAAMVFCESELPKIGDYIAQKSLASLRKDEGISAIWSPFCIALHSLRSRALRIIGSHQQSCASFVQVVKGMKEFKDYEEHFDVEFYEECLKECAEQMAKLGRIQESIEILSM